MSETTGEATGATPHVSVLDRYFGLTRNGTEPRTEIIAGVTTFLTMAYIVFVNPQILGAAGMDKGAVFVATCIAAAASSLVMGLYANYPIAEASITRPSDDLSRTTPVPVTSAVMVSLPDRFVLVVVIGRMLDQPSRTRQVEAAPQCWWGARCRLEAIQETRDRAAIAPIVTRVGPGCSGNGPSCLALPQPPEKGLPKRRS
jgi:hypothetical protein